MKITDHRLRYLIREALDSSFSATGSSGGKEGAGGGSPGAGQIVKYDAAAVERAKAAGLTASEAGQVDDVWQFKFSGSGDSRVWHASKDGSSWRNIGSDPNNKTIKRLNAAFPISTRAAGADSGAGSGDEAAALVAEPEQ